MTKKQLRVRVVEKVVLAVALVTGISCAASAGDYYRGNSNSRLGGDSYAYFGSQPVGKPATRRQDNPHGLSARMLQAYSATSASSAWQLEAPAFSSTASDSTFRQTHPNGLTEGELQVLSSPGPAWHSGAAPANTRPTVVLQPFAGRLVRSSGTDSTRSQATGE